MQPLGWSMDLEVRIGSERRPGVGVVFDHAEAREDNRSAYRTLTALPAEGLFTRRGEVVYRLEFHYRSADDWQKFLDRPRAGGVEADPQVLASALAHADGRIVATEETTLSIYDRSS